MAFETNLGLIALTRFGYGPRGDGDVAIAAGDPSGVLKAELAQQPICACDPIGFLEFLAGDLLVPKQSAS